MIDRRRVLQGLVAGAALGARSAWAETPPRARVLPAPDFTRLREVEPYVVGVRPYRKGGVRLGLDAPIGGKPLIHNYGHAGAGITLSLGCAEEVADLVDGLAATLPTLSVAVVGTGVIGMASALAIATRHPGVPLAVYAKDLALGSTTSAVAGGQFEPAGIWGEHTDPASSARLESWLRRAKERIVELQPRWSTFGIAERDNYTLDHGTSGFDSGTPHDVVAKPDRLPLPFADLTAPGRRYRTWLLDPPRLLPALRAELVERGVRFVERTFGSRAELAAVDEAVIVNCTGYGAKALLGDDDVIAQRGHLVVLQRPSEQHDYLFGGGCANRVNHYVFCRHDDIVVGGTMIAGDDRAAVVPEDQPTFDRLLSNASEVFAGRPDRCER